MTEIDKEKKKKKRVDELSLWHKPQHPHHVKVSPRGHLSSREKVIQLDVEVNLSSSTTGFISAEGAWAGGLSSLNFSLEGLWASEDENCQFSLFINTCFFSWRVCGDTLGLLRLKF